MRFLLMIILVLFGFSFVDLQAKPIKKDLANKEFVSLDYSAMSPKLLFIEEVAQSRKFDLILSSKRSTGNCQIAIQTYKKIVAKNNKKGKPTIRML